MAEEQQRTTASSEITDEDLNELFTALRLDNPDPPLPRLIIDLRQNTSGVQTETPCWIECGCAIMEGADGAREQNAAVCAMHEGACDVYTHSVERARQGRDVVSLHRCALHEERVHELCQLCYELQWWAAQRSVQHTVRRTRGRRNRRRARK